MNATATLTRLDALELHFGGRCELCRDWPSTRIVTTDETTGETRPAVCPRCGREPAHGSIEIIGVDFGDLP